MYKLVEGWGGFTYLCMHSLCFDWQISCGAAHTLAVTGEGAVWSWGCGGGGRLGHGDVRDRFSPTLIEGLKGSSVTMVAAGLWHSAALVHVPPLARGRMVSRWIERRRRRGEERDRGGGKGTWMQSQLMTRGPAETRVSAAVYVVLWWQVYTWGSGYCGQLGQGSTLVSLRPEVVEHLLNTQVHGQRESGHRPRGTQV
jgi:hypothetical protein